MPNSNSVCLDKLIPRIRSEYSVLALEFNGAICILGANLTYVQKRSE